MLKVLHTADWHLGHTLHGVSRQVEHSQFLTWLLAQLLNQAIDALLICGDIFDSANPPASAQTQLYDFLVQAKRQQPRLTIILIGGNHDSAQRLDAPASLLHTLDVHVIGGLPRLPTGEIAWDRLCIPLCDATGDIAAWCGAMPFLRNADVSVYGADAAEPLITGVRNLYAQLIAQLTCHASPEQSLLLTGHCYMVGGQLSELSERKILGGHQHALPVDIFPSHLDYVALGHLHRPQAVGHHAHIRYSGSPIPLSFDETHYPHQVLLVQLNAHQPAHVSALPVPRCVQLIRVPNGQDYASLAQVLALLNALALDRQLATFYQPFVELRILLTKPEPNLHADIDAAISKLPLRVLKRSIAFLGQGNNLSELVAEQHLEELQPVTVFQRCYFQQYAQEPPAELTQLFCELLETVQIGE